MFWLARWQEQVIADTQLNIEEVRSETAIQRLLKPPNQFLFLRKKVKRYLLYESISKNDENYVSNN